MSHLEKEKEDPHPALSRQRERGSSGQYHRLDPGEKSPPRRRGNLPRRIILRDTRDRGDMLGRGAAAAADDIDDALLAPLPDLRGGGVRAFVIGAEIVG